MKVGIHLLGWLVAIFAVASVAFSISSGEPTVILDQFLVVGVVGLSTLLLLRFSRRVAVSR
ncbi:hypothetical protein [Natrononativus amylolyticus]|uniref:hypothetical protein n=1 Tax=Natrononativus amylolyticus TaxID=2963434 RepID=UPI0020CF31F4|nr:hypothetical protein [Natrononativus amylolyticus]